MKTLYSHKILFTEKLYPNFSIWIIIAGYSGLFYFVFTPIGIIYGVISPLLFAILISFLLLLNTPKITLTDKCLIVDKKIINHKFLNKPQIFTGEEARKQKAEKLDARYYMCMRGWIEPIIKIKTKNYNKIPGIIISTRKPEEFIKAYNAVYELEGDPS